jgi:hypothetical protein
MHLFNMCNHTDVLHQITLQHNWRTMEEGQTHYCCHGLLERVLRMKVTQLAQHVMKQNTFGPTQCWIYSIRWQKRGQISTHTYVNELGSFTAWLFMARALSSLQWLMVHVWTSGKPFLPSNCAHTQTHTR